MPVAVRDSDRESVNNVRFHSAGTFLEIVRCRRNKPCILPNTSGLVPRTDQLRAKLNHRLPTAALCQKQMEDQSAFNGDPDFITLIPRDDHYCLCISGGKATTFAGCLAMDGLVMLRALRIDSATLNADEVTQTVTPETPRYGILQYGVVTTFPVCTSITGEKYHVRTT